MTLFLTAETLLEWETVSVRGFTAVLSVWVEIFVLTVKVFFFHFYLWCFRRRGVTLMCQNTSKCTGQCVTHIPALLTFKHTIIANHDLGKRQLDRQQAWVSIPKFCVEFCRLILLLIDSIYTKLLVSVILCVWLCDIILKGVVPPKMKILSSFTKHSPSGCPKPVQFSVICWTRKKIFWKVLVARQLTSIAGKKAYGSQWGPKTVWLPTFFKISSFVFNR